MVGVAFQLLPIVFIVLGVMLFVKGGQLQLPSKTSDDDSDDDDDEVIWIDNDAE